jgi:DNA-binding transcriptional MerR regulator
MRIGELAERVGTSTRAIRHYEDQGLLAARRLSNGYRDYDEADLRLVEEIRSLLAIGFALEETRPFVECLRAGHPSGDACPDSVAAYRSKIVEVDGYLARLGAVRAWLESQLRRAVDREAAAAAAAGTPAADVADAEAPPGCETAPPPPISSTSISSRESGHDAGW